VRPRREVHLSQGVRDVDEVRGTHPVRGNDRSGQDETHLMSVVERLEAMDEVVAAFLLTRARPKLGGIVRCGDRQLDARTCCVEREVGPGRLDLPDDVEVGGERRVERCSRPVWGDGCVLLGSGNREFDMCSFHWHEWNAFHGDYVTLKANPAAATIDDTGLARLFITRGLDAEPLPPVGNDVPDTFPGDWDT
jgi:hypothetical protein